MRVDFRLANVLMKDSSRSVAYPNLYHRCSKVPVSDGEDAMVFSKPSCDRWDFATYFNAFSNIKWRRYTCIDNVWLRVRATGNFTITYVGYEVTPDYPKRVVYAERTVSARERTDIDFSYPETDAALLSFELTTSSPVRIEEAYYFSQVDDSMIRPVELAVATTTFKKEEFVIPNIELLRRELGHSHEAIGGHFTMHVIDNGRTLDAKGLTGDCVVVHPNPNVGGAGGFARGMIEAREQEPKATHVILMDDDVQVSPESVKRSFNLLSLVRDDYKEAFLSGAMLSFEQQDRFYEDVGCVRAGDGLYGPTKKARNLSKLKSIVLQETLEAHVSNRYAGWWYCCIPMSVIERKGLPLPLFIRCDDAEYGARCTKRFMSMNGICIWHLTLAYKFRAHLERYQVLRNSLIDQSTTGVFSNVNFRRTCKINFEHDLKTFYYSGAEVTIRAIEDYLKGPEYLKHVDGSKLIAELAEVNERLLPIEEIDDPEVATLDYRPDLVHKSRPNLRDTLKRAYDYLTMNGQRMPGFVTTNSIAVIPYDGWSYAPDAMRNHTRFLAITPDGTQGILRRFDRKRARDLSRRFDRVMREFDRRRKEVRAAWAAARDELTSVAFWKDYLKRMGG